jgi:hypothetical protein
MEKQSTHLQFVDSHMPAMDAGDYELKVRQILSDGDGNTATYEKQLSFSVLGDRFGLAPTMVHSAFPPPNGLGEYGGVLPHIVLNRSTLPWERDAQPDNEVPSWLALLVLYPSELETMPLSDSPAPKQAQMEAQTGYALELSDLMPGGFEKSDNFKAAQKAWPGIELETGQQTEDRTNVIFVRRQKLEPLLPTLTDLTHLVHIRRGTDEQGNLKDEEQVVLLANRLPKSGEDCIVHLVSMENRYAAGGFQFHEADPDDPVPLISLHSWRFASVSRKHTFRGLLLHLNQVPIFRVPVSEELEDDLNTNHRGIPSAIRTLFQETGHPVSKGGETDDTDRAKLEVILKDHHLIIGNSGRVYDQAGYFLFQMEGITKDADKAPKEDLIAKIKKAGYPVNEHTAVNELEVQHWWLEDTNTQRRYFIRHEWGHVEALQLELDHAPVLRLPETGHAAADRFLHQGYVPLPHYPRRGGKTVSWYRGPLITAEKRNVTLDKNIFAINTSDELVLYHTDVGLFDVTYAAAWELGRLLALRSKRFSVGLHRWRRKHARSIAMAELHEAHLHLPMSGEQAKEDASVLPPVLHEWLNNLWNLEGVPYNYLIPDERLLPNESLRFFTLDPDWMACLIHGAFSIGKTAGTDHWKEAKEGHPVMQQLNSAEPISGFLLKSEVVSAYPGMQIEILDEQNNKLKLLKRPLSNDTTLCLLTGEAHEVHFFLAPEVVHFGFEKNDEGGFHKYPHNAKGEVMDNSIPVSYDESSGMVDIEQLFKQVHQAWGAPENFGSASFALALIEGSQKVIYRRK